MHILIVIISFCIEWNVSIGPINNYSAFSMYFAHVEMLLLSILSYQVITLLLAQLNIYDFETLL